MTDDGNRRSGEPLVEAHLPVEEPFDLSSSLTVKAFFSKNAVRSLGPSPERWLTKRTPEGAVTLRFLPRRGELLVSAWGPGARWGVEHAERLCGLADREALAFSPQEQPLKEIHHQRQGLRMAAGLGVYEALVPVVLAQKVAGKEAKRSAGMLVRRHGSPAPGPLDLRLLPSPEKLARLGYEQFHQVGVEKRRALVLMEIARNAERLEGILEMSREDAYHALVAVPGIGPWTAANVLVRARGDADAVILGDYNLPSLVAWNLVGEPRADDARMLELLAPYAGHRARVLRLLELGGRHPPRFGPRRALRRIDRI